MNILVCMLNLPFDTFDTSTMSKSVFTVDLKSFWTWLIFHIFYPWLHLFNPYQNDLWTKGSWNQSYNLFDRYKSYEMVRTEPFGQIWVNHIISSLWYPRIYPAMWMIHHLIHYFKLRKFKLKCHFLQLF